MQHMVLWNLIGGPWLRPFYAITRTTWSAPPFTMRRTLMCKEGVILGATSRVETPNGSDGKNGMVGVRGNETRDEKLR